MRLPLFSALFPLFLLSITPAAVADDEFFPADKNRVVLGVGVYNATDSDSEQRYATYRAELRMSEIQVWKLHPWAGIVYAHNGDLDEDIDSFWIGAGLETDINLYEDWLVLTLQTGVGYFDDGDDVPVAWQYLPNDGLEFRHQIELAARFKEKYRAGLALSHMSNGDLSDNNNSINSLTLNLHMPLGD